MDKRKVATVVQEANEDEESKENENETEIEGSGREEEHETSEAASDDDDHWKVIQKNTFTRWMNQHLKVVDKRVIDLETDLSDGLLIISLVEILSGKRFPRYSRRPIIRAQKLENVSTVLDFLTNGEQVSIVNIGSSDIVDGNLKLLLGLIWSLISHYAILLPTNESEAGTTKNLLAWIQNKIPDRHVTNMTTDWNDGTAVGALVNSIVPGLCSNWRSWDSKGGIRNATEAMNAAETWLDVSQIIEPEELCNRRVDSYSVVIYLSQFLHAKMKPDASLETVSSPVEEPVCPEILVYGPGIEPSGNVVGIAAKFTISIFPGQCAAEWSEGDVRVIVLNPRGERDYSIQSETELSDDGTIICHSEYLPDMAGNWTVTINYLRRDIPIRSFLVGVERPPIVVDSRKCYATGRGIQPKGIRVGDVVTFIVHTKALGEEGDLNVVISDPDGYDNVSVQVNRMNQHTYSYVYNPRKSGLYSISVTHCGGHISRSPFRVDVGRYQESKVRAIGPGLKGGFVSQPAFFIVETRGEASMLEFSIVGRSSAKIEALDNGDGSLDVVYWPVVAGECAVHVLCDGEDIPNSPFMSLIRPQDGIFDPAKVIASGSGLLGLDNFVDHWAEFLVDTRPAGTASLLATVLDADCEPVELLVEVNKDGTYMCSYLPSNIGKHSIIISYGGVSISSSAFKIQIHEPAKNICESIDADISRNSPPHLELDNLQCDFHPIEDTDIVSPPVCDVSKIHLVGLDNKVFVQSTTEFAIYTEDIAQILAGHPCDNNTQVLITSPDGIRTEAVVSSNGNGVCKCKWTPIELGMHFVEVSCENVRIPASPFVIDVVSGCHPSHVKAFGSGLEDGFTSQIQVFTIETRGAGLGELGLTIEGPSDAKMTCKDNLDGSCTVEYRPTRCGEYKISMKFADQEICGSPFQIIIKDKDCENSEPIEKTHHNWPESNTIQSTASGSATSTNANESHERSDVLENIRESAKTSTQSNGYMNLQHESFPNMTMMQQGKDVLQSYDFCIPCGLYVDGFLDVRIISPNNTSSRPNSVNKNKDGTVTVHYQPIEVGLHSLKVGSSKDLLKFFVAEVWPGSVTAYGRGLSHGFAGLPSRFTIRPTSLRAGSGRLSITFEGPSKIVFHCEETQEGDCAVTYLPSTPGEYSISIKFQDIAISGSPFTVNIFDSNQNNLLNLDKVRDTDLSNFSAIVRNPCGLEELSSLLRLANGHLGISYTPRHIGEYSVDIYRASADSETTPHEQQVISRYNFCVGHNEVADPRKVRAYGDGLSKGEADLLNEFTVDTKFGGYGVLSVSVVGPSKADVEFRDDGDGLCVVAYRMASPGEYIVSVKFADEHVTGSVL